MAVILSATLIPIFDIFGAVMGYCIGLIVQMTLAAHKVYSVFGAVANRYVYGIVSKPRGQT